MIRRRAGGLQTLLRHTLRHTLQHALRLMVLLLVCTLALQLYFVARVALMRWVDPQSSAFQRSQAVHILQRDGHLPWNQTWQPLAEMGTALPRAVLASEDAAFTEHSGLDWDAIDRARERNEQRQARQDRSRGAARLHGGSTLSQQLAKNLFLSGERTMWRKAQEAVITLAMEALLDKRRILEIYLNTVEWGEGVYGAHAAAEHYFRVQPAALQPYQAARLAVMLPAPRRFEKRPQSEYLQQRAGVIVARMPAVKLP